MGKSAKHDKKILGGSHGRCSENPSQDKHKEQTLVRNHRPDYTYEEGNRQYPPHRPEYEIQ
jgi:hypothetical protein